ncbi:hypothetical protein PsorP6_009363 [Peronosclerospora sorghi]|uniref:Uncharacterized protein n=1 Tax=Peronosclerospora sorghi TaxID=230839 RepID=A0ACC0VYY2_9STRA|nr:hypothetical protein PsorP6_009363 [Peronosclerospora sorghi]
MTMTFAVEMFQIVHVVKRQEHGVIKKRAPLVVHVLHRDIKGTCSIRGFHIVLRRVGNVGHVLEFDQILVHGLTRAIVVVLLDRAVIRLNLPRKAWTIVIEAQERVVARGMLVIIHWLMAMKKAKGKRVGTLTRAQFPRMFKHKVVTRAEAHGQRWREDFSYRDEARNSAALEYTFRHEWIRTSRSWWTHRGEMTQAMHVSIGSVRRDGMRDQQQEEKQEILGSRHGFFDREYGKWIYMYT